MADAKMLKKVPVREQDPKVRATNFEEVCLGYNQEEAMEVSTEMLRLVRNRNVWKAVLYPLIFLDLLKRLKRERSKKHTK